MQRTLLIVLASAVLAAACHSGPEFQGVWVSPYLTGTILNAKTGKPVAGATVEIQGRIPGVARSITIVTGENGRYRGIVTAPEDYRYTTPAQEESYCAFKLVVTHPRFENNEVERERKGLVSADGPCAGWKLSLDVALERPEKG